jgi:hypothetical protein
VFDGLRHNVRSSVSEIVSHLLIFKIDLFNCHIILPLQYITFRHSAAIAVPSVFAVPVAFAAGLAAPLLLLWASASGSFAAPPPYLDILP